MKNKHHIVVETQRLKYEFDIKRNITVIQGDSATGKTTLVELLGTYSRFGKESGISLQSDVPCVVFGGDAGIWKTILEAYQDSIIFIDEDYSFIYSKDFAELIQKSSNYYVLITRQPLYNLPYSIQEIYGIRTTGKYHYPEKIYHEFYQIYDNLKITANKDVLVMVEDSKSGYQFFSKACKQGECVSVEGNSQFVGRIENADEKKKVVVIADGAAFGAYVAKVTAIAKGRKDVMLYFPESFEWLILKSGIIRIKDLDAILAEPEKYIESREFFSWERYFTDLLMTATADDSIKKYDKSQLKPFYIEGKNKDAIIAVLPEELRKIIW
ncbi:translation initiation factor 2 [Butyrivibrio fibrisolvens]|uniref:Translation initiation factor 2 n=1 Tax=Butyrivibrio fibrisolvens TaxID=831 RepID=A0A317G343_BUTFI|nr:translation initiation factor 2 [Butyrivibrio fibrisolvens]PWT27561.1 translation initiation factor 2 [Butyrivibrio fibrisolvens]